MYRRLALRIGVVVLALAGTTVAAGSASAAPAGSAAHAGRNAAVQAGGLASTIALNNCSAALVRYPSSTDSDRALMLTNGHCYEGGMPAAGEVVQNRSSTRSGTLLDGNGTALGTVRADKMLYATMTNTDVTLYELTDTFAALKTRYAATALTIADSHPADGAAMTIPSSYWKQVWTCQVNGFVGTLREDKWTWHDSLRYNTGCTTTHGTSGSPIIESSTGRIIGINNTGNDDGAMCTLNNPCEVDANGNTTAHKGQSYGEETYWFTTCLSASNAIDLTVSGCLLTKPAGSGTTVTVTNPGSQAATVGAPVSLQIQARSSGTNQTLTYTATGLPAGLSINSTTGLISGTPTTAQNSSTTVTVRDSTGSSGSATFAWSVRPTGGSCTGQVLANPGFEAGTGSWTASSGVIGQHTANGQPAHTGTWAAWLDGYGSTHTDTISQSVSIPAGCHATLSFWLHVDTNETTTSTAYDKLTVQIGSSTLDTLSNRNAAGGYVQKSYDVSALAGQTVPVTFTGTEDTSLQTSFVVDDTALNLS